MSQFLYNKNIDRAYSSSLLRTIIARNHLPFFQNIVKFSIFLPKFLSYFPFFNIFPPVIALFLKNRTHACTF